MNTTNHNYKERERERETIINDIITDYDDLLTQINTETNPNADYTEQINSLDYTHLSSNRSKYVLINVWKRRKAWLTNH